MTAIAMKSAFEQDRVNLRPKKFLMWLFIITSFMLFAALTSGFIVYTAGDPSRGIKMLLPSVFKYSTVAIVLSSITLHFASKSAKELKFSNQRLFLLLTISLGVIFLILQVSAWKSFVASGVYFVNPNASQSFLYVLTGAHLLHIIAGIAVLGNAYRASVKNIVQYRNLFKMELASIFWHFLDILWIYLYVFLLLNQ